VEDLRSAVTRDFASILVAPDSDEPRVTQSMLRRPLEKLDAGNKERIQPAAHIHFRGGETFSPVPSLRSGKLTKPHLGTWSSSKCGSRSRRDVAREAGSNPACIDKIANLIVSDQDGVHDVMVGNVASDDEFLSALGSPL